MAVFKVETKNKVDIDKKPRVYFTCHPDDFDKYFKKICDDIFKTHDCAIYYTKDMTEIIPEEERGTDLGRNNLFVIPVTFKLLATPNRAMNEDIPYALKEHIPVLPIMMEPGIDEFYSKPDKFGEMQYLNPYSTDLTEISYEEKLKKYLESVLISDELAKRVRAAFDAYIFLSYRKKDRKYANELMRLIHRNPECRDIAIWYDEFLTPGENFNDSIKEALQKSDLFVLTVTPNLLNEPNYIMITEYPMAKQEGKPILPAEIVPTDKKQLFEMFKDIPIPIDAHNDVELLQTLLKAIKKTAVDEKNVLPERNYLIGLAYLGGIDVEKDSKIALKLLTDAAEHGSLEAMKKLSRMYFYADGTVKNVQKSYFWHEKYTENLVLIFDQMPTVESANKLSTERLLYALMLTGDEASLLIAEQEYKKNISFYKTILKSMDLKRLDDEEYMSELADCYHALGSFYKWDKKLPLQAIEQYYLAIEILEILTDLKHGRHCIKLAELYGALSSMLLDLSELNEAESFALKRIFILEKYSKDEVKVGDDVFNFEWHYKKELADSYRDAGYFYYVINSLEKAAEYYKNAIRLLKEWLTVGEDDIYCLVEVYNDIQKVYTANNQLDKILEIYFDEFDTLLNVSAEYQENHVSRISMLSIRILSMLIQQKAFHRLVEYLKMVLPLWDRFYTENKMQSYNYLATGYYIVGVVLMKNNQLDKALFCMNRSVNVLEILFKQSENHRKNLDEVYKTLSSLYKLKGEHAMAKYYDEKTKML